MHQTGSGLPSSSPIKLLFLSSCKAIAGLGILLVFLSDGMFIITLLLNVFSSETQKAV